MKNEAGKQGGSWVNDGLTRNDYITVDSDDYAEVSCRVLRSEYEEKERKRLGNYCDYDIEYDM